MITKLDPMGEAPMPTTDPDLAKRGLLSFELRLATYVWWKKVKVGQGVHGHVRVVDLDLFYAAERCFAPKDVQDYFEMILREDAKRERARKRAKERREARKRAKR